MRLHWRKNSILECLFQTTHTKKPWAVLTPRPTAFSQVRNGRKKKSRRRDHLVSPTACRCDVLLRYLQLRANVFPKKGHSTTLGDTKRINNLHAPTRAEAPPAGELRCRDSHTHPFLLFCAGILVLLRAATTMKITCPFSRVNQSRSLI
jgi:hypothetical protein